MFLLISILWGIIMAKKDVIIGSNLYEIVPETVKLQGVEKSLALFRRVSASIEDAVKVNRVISAKSLFSLNEKNYYILQALLAMADGSQFTFAELQKSIFKKIDKGSSVSNGNSIAFYYTLKDAIREADIIKSVMILASFGIRLHLTINKNGVLSVKRHDAKETLLSASFYLENVLIIDGEEKKTRKTVRFLPEFIEKYYEVMNAPSFVFAQAQLTTYMEAQAKLSSEAKQELEKIAQ